MTARALTRTLLVSMLREEWRLHARLFGGRRFAAFPLLVAVLAGGAVWALVETGTDPGRVVAGLHALVFLFGLHTGSIGFVGHDALRGLLGDVNLVVGTSRTLPVSRRRLLAVFLVKDALYYAVLFLLPLGLAFAPVLSPARLPLLWLSTTVTFVAGAALTVAGVACTTRGVPGRALLLGVAVGLGLAVAAGVDLLSYTPYALYRDPAAPASLATLLWVPVLAVVGLALYDTERERAARTGDDGFTRWRRRVPGGDPLVARSLLDVSRSGGGFGKVLFSAAVLFAVAVWLVDLVGRVTGVPPSLPVSVGALLGLTGFTTYNWLTQFDGPGAYASLPVSTADVLRAKWRAFLLVAPPAAVAAYVVAVAWRGGDPAAVLAGLVLCLGLLVYLFGLTVALAGLRPNEFLFDTALFAAFGVGVAVPLVPVLVAGFVLAPYDAPTLAALLLAGPVLALVGVGLYRRSLPRWERAAREA